MVDAAAVRLALAGVSEPALLQLCRVADRFLAGHPLGTGGEPVKKARPGARTEFVDHREYAPGDDLRTVDWRASARSHRVHVRRYRDETSSRWLLCLDRSASMGIHDGDKWLRTVQVAAALAYLIVRRGSAAGLLTFSTKVDHLCRAGRGRRQQIRLISALRDSLPRQRGGSSRAESCARYIGRGTSVVVISDFLAPDAMLPQIDALAACGARLHLLQILSPREAQPDGPGTLLQDIETGQRRWANDAETFPSTDAAARIDALSRALGEGCRRRGLPFQRANSTTPWQPLLCRFLPKVRPGHA